ncbi:MAG: type VI secretion system baseplate subunit TssG [Tepidisphaerales bacterium]
MAAPDGTQKYSLIDAFLKRADEFDFYQAVRRLEAVNPEKPRIGQSLRVADDCVRFCQKPSLRFEPVTVTGYQQASQYAPDRLFVAFMGLLGPHGPMPLHLTEYIRARELQANDPTLARFFDVFNHRMIALFYRAWRTNQQAVSFDRPDQDRFLAYFGSLIGISTPPFRNRDAIQDMAKLHYCGRLACPTKSAEGLVAILVDYFRVPVELEEFVGQWIELPVENRLRLAESPETGTIGRTAIMGSRVWECQHKFRLRIGPLTLADYQRLLPRGVSLRRLHDWVRNYCGDQFGFEVQLVLRKQDVPKLRPGVIGQLGWTTWLSTKKFEEDADDLVLQVA